VEVEVTFAMEAEVKDGVLVDRRGARAAAGRCGARLGDGGGVGVERRVVGPRLDPPEMRSDEMG
jgi:hypothetical protein